MALDDEFRRPVRSDVPTLILVGDLDPRTPTENAHEIASTLSRAQVITLENATHQFDLFGSAPMRALLQRFLRGSHSAPTGSFFPRSPSNDRGVRGQTGVRRGSDRGSTGVRPHGV